MYLHIHMCMHMCVVNSVAMSANGLPSPPNLGPSQHIQK